MTVTSAASKPFTGSSKAIVTVNVSFAVTLCMKADQASTSLKIPDELYSKTIVPRLVK